MIKKNPQLFFEIAKEILSSGNEFRFKATGKSMRPFIEDGDTIKIKPIGNKKLKKGQVAFYSNEANHLLAHRIHAIKNVDDITIYTIRGDGLVYDIEYINHDSILGIAVEADRNGKKIKLNTIFTRYYPLMYFKTIKCRTRIKSAIKSLVNS
ncbi:MAG: hypothetical protein PF692_04280 [Kiritimatiellae bacterium]|nr:hypothetical protein [Kiritimatiellia bacterium]